MGQPMVTYQIWTRIVFEIVRETLGDELGRAVANRVVEIAAEVWNDHKADLEEMDQVEATAFARQEIEVTR